MKAQLTAFMIVGIVILFIIAFTIYILVTLRNQQPEMTITKEDTGLQNCFEDAAENAIETVALQGGTGSNTITTAAGEKIGVAATRTEVSIEPLCLSNGPNKPYAGYDGPRTCMSGTYQMTSDPDTTLQQAITSMTQRNLVVCGIQDQVTIIFGGDDITVKAGERAAQIPVRFKRLYNAAFWLVIHDMSNLTFNKHTAEVYGCPEPANRNNCLFPSMLISTADAGEYSIITITDTDRTRGLRGEPFRFRFAMQNRAPVIIQGPAATIDVTGDWPIPLDIPLIVVDPDDEGLIASCEAEYTSQNWITACSTTGIGIQVECYAGYTTSLTYRVCDRLNVCATNVSTINVIDCPL